MNANKIFIGQIIFLRVISTVTIISTGFHFANVTIACTVLELNILFKK